jgi:integrase/recombinase XerD
VVRSPLCWPHATGRPRQGAGISRLLTLLVRLGLRAGEVAALNLDELDWRRGEITVRGKANRHDRLPLPGDVGQAIVDYLRYARPVRFTGGRSSSGRRRQTGC